MSAAYAGYFPVVKFLVEQGADVNSRDVYGDTSLQKAEEMGRKKASGEDPWVNKECGDGYSEIIEYLKPHVAEEP